MNTAWYVLVFTLIGGLISLAGGMLLLSKKSTAQALAVFATPFAAGALLGAAFFDLLPEAFANLEVEQASAWVLGGILAFFLLEHFLHWFHHHHDHEGTATPAPLVIVGDSIHNLLDGVAIGAAFLIDVPTGIVTSVAVAAHEIPQEIGDFGLLLNFGYSRKKVILINVLSALLATIGALITFWLGSEYVLPTSILLAITAGMFIYIAASDLIPTIHEESKRKMGNLAPALLVMGVLVVAVVTSVTHNYVDAGHGHGDDNACISYYDKDGTELLYRECPDTEGSHDHQTQNSTSMDAPRDQHEAEHGHTQEEHHEKCKNWVYEEPDTEAEGISEIEAYCMDVLE